MSRGWLPDGCEPWEIPLLEIGDCDPQYLPGEYSELFPAWQAATPDPGTTGPLW